MTQKQRQELFNKATTGVLSQGALCKETPKNGGECAYTIGEMHCGIGWFIPTDVLAESKRYNNKGIKTILAYYSDSPIGQYFKNTYGDDLEAIQFLHELQTAHDMANNFEDFKVRSKEFAKAYKLRFKKLLN
jgi:hypothetical protein